jgi:hypothetical protein
MGAVTAEALIRELGARLGDTVVVTPEAGSSATQFVLPPLAQYLPADVPFNMATGAGLQAWVAASGSVPAPNAGQERRAQEWRSATTTLVLYPPGFPAAPTTGEYEVHLRFPRSRKLAALNAGVRQLHLHWERIIEDESLVAQQHTWVYPLPSTIPWDRLVRVELAPATPGRPFEDARPLGWRLRVNTAANGQTTYLLEFRNLPPAGRTIRLIGVARFPDLQAATDLLVVPDTLLGPVQEWLLDWAELKLWQWTSAFVPAGQQEGVEAKQQRQLERQQQLLVRALRGRAPARVVTPGNEPGTVWQDSAWLGLGHRVGGGG